MNAILHSSWKAEQIQTEKMWARSSENPGAEVGSSLQVRLEFPWWPLKGPHRSRDTEPTFHTHQLLTAHVYPRTAFGRSGKNFPSRFSFVVSCGFDAETSEPEWSTMVEQE